MSLQGPAWPRCVRSLIVGSPLRRPCKAVLSRLSTVVFLAMTTSAPAFAHCHIYRVWHYPKPQKCFTALAPFHVKQLSRREAGFVSVNENAPVQERIDAVEKTATRTSIGSKTGLESNESRDSSQRTLSSMRKLGFSDTSSGLHSPVVNSMVMSETSRGSSHMENVLFKTKLERIGEISLPAVDFTPCPDAADERLQGIAKLHAIMDAR